MTRRCTAACPIPSRPASVIVTDIFMPEKEGIETIQDLRREFPDAKIIAMTGRESLTD
jgi:DNA-binding NarL/FixJ family response regulator